MRFHNFIKSLPEEILESNFMMINIQISTCLLSKPHRLGPVAVYPLIHSDRSNLCMWEPALDLLQHGEEG